MTDKKEWKKLTDYIHTRIRTEYLFGSRSPKTSILPSYSSGFKLLETTYVPAVFTLIREIVDNCLDEIIGKGHGDTLTVHFDDSDMIITVKDNGRGMPIDFDKEEQEYAATVLLSHTKTGRNFDDLEREDARGLNGLGAKGVNYTSEFFEVTIHRDKKVFNQTFREGKDALLVENPIILPSTKKSGTQIRFKPSSEVFNSFTGITNEFLYNRLYEIALINPNLKVIYNDKQIKPLSFSKLIPDYASIMIESEAFKSEIYLGYGLSPEYKFWSLVNSIPCFDGGVHEDSFKRYFVSGLIDSLSFEEKKRKLKLAPRDITEGLFVYNIVNMNAPFFNNQAKTNLTNENVGVIIREALDDNFFKSFVRKNTNFIDKIFEACASRTLKKENKDLKKFAVQNKKVKIAELQDAVGKDRSKCILMLMEGLSAVAGGVAARNPEIHGALPLKGKPMNVREYSLDNVINNDVLSNVMGAIGLVPNMPVDRRKLRYSRVYLTTDADEDGKNIAALLVNFFYTYWKELFDPKQEPFIYVFDTPLIIATKGKNIKYWYNDDIHTFDSDKLKGWEITRAKGLAALKKHDWEEVLKNPKLIPIVDDGKLSDALDLLFNSDKKSADRRKEWIGI